MPRDHDAASLLAALQSSRGSSLALALGAPAHDERSLPASRTALAPSLREALLIPGGVVELVGLPGCGALSLALSCMSEALALRRAGAAATTTTAWLCAIDPLGCLFSPAVQALGVPLERLLVVTPPAAALPRVSVRALKTGVFCAMVVDATDVDDLDRLPVRRFTLGAEAAQATVFLLTRPGARRRQPLPTAARVQLHPGDERGVDVEIERHRHGRRGTLRWQRPQSPIERFFDDE